LASLYVQGILTIYQRIGSYIVTSHCLGSGAFATVHLAIDKARYRQVACKTIKMKKESDVLQVEKELNILAGLDHVRLACFFLFLCLPNILFLFNRSLILIVFIKVTVMESFCMSLPV
jgi:serine/threonine protein kinase